MESVIGLCFSALPSPSVRILPSGFHAARAAKPHLIKLSCSSFSVPKLETRSLSLRYNSSLSLSGNSAGRWPLDSIIGPVCCTADSSPSKQSSKSDEKCQQEQQLRDMVQRLLQSQPLDLANRLKALEPIVKEYFSLSDIIIDAVKELEACKNYNLALKLLKVSEQIFIEEKDSLGTFRFKIMEILYSQGKYKEAFDYWILLCEMKSPQTGRPLFTNMQIDLISTVTKVLEFLKEKIPSKDISSDLLRSMNELKNMKWVNIGGKSEGGGIPSVPPDELGGPN